MEEKNGGKKLGMADRSLLAKVADMKVVRTGH